MFFMQWLLAVPNIMKLRKHSPLLIEWSSQSDISSRQGCICRLCLGKYTRLDPKALQKGGLLFGGFNMKDE